MHENRKTRLEYILNEQFAPFFLEVINESHGHRVPRDAQTHFKVIVVSTQFQSRTTLERHKMIYRHLNQELSSGLHALSLHTFTPEEWQHNNKIIASPQCAHSKLQDP